jgi:hypothetical protein
LAGAAGAPRAAPAARAPAAFAGAPSLQPSASHARCRRASASADASADRLGRPESGISRLPVTLRASTLPRVRAGRPRRPPSLPPSPASLTAMALCGAAPRRRRRRCRCASNAAGCAQARRAPPPSAGAGPTARPGGRHGADGVGLRGAVVLLGSLLGPSLPGIALAPIAPCNRAALQGPLPSVARLRIARLRIDTEGSSREGAAVESRITTEPAPSG